jgi:endonuclease G
MRIRIIYEGIGTNMKIMRNRYFVFLFLTFCVIAAFSTCISVFCRDKDNGDLPVSPKGTPEIILHRIGYTSSYNSKTKQPNWVAWHLTRDHVQGKTKRTSNAWHEDSCVPMPRVNNFDYKGSGWSRGHMCPAGDNKWSRDAMYETFLYSNVCPQHPRLNSGDWNEIEMACRRWAEKYGDIYIVCGPIFLRQEHEIIGVSKIPVPEAFFKVVMCLNGTPKGIGFVCRNTEGNRNKDKYVNSISQIERITGMTFFPNLSKEVTVLVKNKADISEW